MNDITDKMLFLLTLLFCMSLVASAPHQNYDSVVPLLDGRIVGGESTVIEEFPYQASLLYFSSHRCGAAIISENYVLTATHCTIDATHSYLTLRVGATYRNTGGTVIQISEVHEHPQYNSDSYDYDITVLRLASSLSFGSAVQPIALPQQGQAFVPGKISRVTGWGATTENGSPASQLQVVEIPLMTTEQCRNSYGVENVTERMFCAGYPEGGKDACQGDSGGPLAVDGVLLGLVSWGEGCAKAGAPGVYTNLITLRNYIAGITGL